MPKPKLTDELWIDPAFEKKLLNFEPAYRIRLRALYVQYLGGDTKQKLIEELANAKLIPKELADEAGDRIAGGTAGLANWINLAYPGLNVSRRSVDNYLKGRGLPKGCGEPMPAPVNTYHLKSLNKPWVEKYLGRGMAVNGEGTERSKTAREEIEDAKAKQEKIIAARMERELDEKWILRADAEFTISATCVDLHSIWKKHLEQIENRMKQHNLTPEQIAGLQQCRMDVLKAIEESIQSHAQS